jgi:hypothetical protein
MTPVRQDDTHRFILSKYTFDGGSVLGRIADDDAHLADLSDLDHATNDRLFGEHNLLLGIGVHELLFSVPYARIVNAAFCHAHPLGSRFNGPDRGAWYAAVEQNTAIAEVAFHKTVHLAEINRFDDEVTYDDYLSDIHAELYDLRPHARRQPGGSSMTLQSVADILAPDSYIASQALAARLLELEALGIIYPSVRRSKGTCPACFRPAVVGNVRKGETFTFCWDGTPTPSVTLTNRPST